MWWFSSNLYILQVVLHQNDLSVSGASSRRVQAGPSINATTSMNHYDGAMNNILKTVCTVVVMYFICWTPNELIWVLNDLGLTTIDYNSWTYRLTLLAQFCTSFINPVIYAIKYKDFKQGYTLMLHRVSQAKVRPSDISTKITVINVAAAATAT